MSIKVSHEVPKILLKDSEVFNDFQYALVHLLEEDEEYRNYFINYKNTGGEIYLDNSLHEKGYAIGGDTLIKWINILEPSNIFIPDVWEDMNESLYNAHLWKDINVPIMVEKVAVVQAQSYVEAVCCVSNYKKMGYKKIAFSYGASYYLDVFPHPNIDFGKAMGRVSVISKLYKDRVLTKDDRVHLLGASLPQEFLFYNNLPFIESLDTSNPIMAAFDGLKYNNYGLKSKPKSNMNSCFNINYVSPITNSILQHNVSKFRELNNLEVIK
jgi:hypothetical protein